MLRSRLRLNQADNPPGLLRRVAFHEAGHAIIGAALGLGRIDRMMITEGGGEIHRHGMASESLLTDIEDEICYDLGGRAAERLITGIASAGAAGPEQSDLARATTRALHLESVYGLGPEGPVWHHNPGAMLMQDGILRARVRQRIERQERRAGEILVQHRPTLEALARTLMEKRSLNSAEIAVHLRKISHPPTSADAETVAQIDEILEALAAEI